MNRKVYIVTVYLSENNKKFMFYCTKHSHKYRFATFLLGNVDRDYKKIKSSNHDIWFYLKKMVTENKSAIMKNFVYWSHDLTLNWSIC